MPRAPKGPGGARSGAPGVAYPNRTDLNQGPRQLPITAAPDQPYGEAGAQRAAQAIAPMASGPLTNASPTQDPNTPPPLAPGRLGPGQMPDLFRPTERPNEHFMTGVDAGPGQGSEALAPMPGTNNVADTLLAQLATVPNPGAGTAFMKNYLAMQQQNNAPASALGS